MGENFGTAALSSLRLMFPNGKGLSMAAYIVVEGRNLNRETIMAYVTAVRGLIAESGSLLQEHNGRLLFRGTPQNYELLEGADGADLYQVLEFPTLDDAKGFWLGDEYQAVKKLREGAGDFRIVLVDS